MEGERGVGGEKRDVTDGASGKGSFGRDDMLHREQGGKRSFGRDAMLQTM